MAREASIGVLPGSPTWRALEPNNISNFGKTIRTVSRTPISRSRQRSKGTVVDLDSAVEFEADVTMDSIEDFTEGFAFARAVNYDLVWRGADATTGGYSVPAIAAAAAAKMTHTAGGPSTLVFARGYALTANNGLKVLNVDPDTSDVLLECSGNAAETAPDKSMIEVCGIRPRTGDLAVDATGTWPSQTAVISSGNNAATPNIDFTTIGLSLGQFIGVGRGTNKFTTDPFYGRIIAISASSITLDRLSRSVADDAGAAKIVDILFGRFIRNVSFDDVDYLDVTYQMEAAFPNIGPGGGTEYEYAIGNYCNEMTLTLPLTDKATMTFGFIGSDTEDSTDTRKTNADTPIDPVKKTAVNTTSDIARMVVQGVDGSGITTDFKSLSISIRNNVSPEKVIGFFGSKYVNFGTLEVAVEAQLVFTSFGVPDAIKNNTTVGFFSILKNDDGVAVLDIPSMTLGGGGKEYPVNESILLNATGEAFEDSALGTSIGISLIPVRAE